MFGIIEGVAIQESGDVERAFFVPVVTQDACVRPREFEPRHRGDVDRGLGLNDAPIPVFSVHFGKHVGPKEVDVGRVETVHVAPYRRWELVFHARRTTWLFYHGDDISEGRASAARAHSIRCFNFGYFVRMYANTFC